MTSTIRGYLTLRRGNKKKKQQQRGNISDLFFSVTSSSVGPVSLVSHRHSRSFLDLRDLSEDAFKRRDRSRRPRGRAQPAKDLQEAAVTASAGLRRRKDANGALVSRALAALQSVRDVPQERLARPAPAGRRPEPHAPAPPAMSVWVCGA